MAEEIYYAPLALSKAVRLDEVVAQFSAHGLQMKIQEHAADMCWLYTEKFKTQFVVSTTPDEKKEVCLITVELMVEDGAQFIANIESIVTSLGFSCDPDVQYR